MQTQKSARVQSEHVVELLQQRQELLPPILRLFAQNLLLLWEQLQADNKEALLSHEGVRLLDAYIYTSPPTYGRLVTGGAGGEATIEDLLRIVFLQGQIHQQLQQMGIVPINPAEGDLFDARFHEAQETDMIWTQAPAEHNRVAAVKRLGYQADGSVIRKAEVKRLLLGAAENYHTPINPETNLFLTPSHLPNSSRPDPAINTAVPDDSLDLLPDMGE